MLSSDKRGIQCDKCGLTVIEKFTYYSFDAQEAVVTNGTISFAAPAGMSHMGPMFSFDICSRCMEEYKAIIKRCYKPSRIIDNRSCPNGIFCDFTGVHMRGSFICYYICVSIVVVDINMKPSTRVTDDKFVELWISAEAFEQLLKRAKEIHANKENKEWSSQSISTK